jgi:hypothetical protein
MKTHCIYSYKRTDVIPSLSRRRNIGYFTTTRADVGLNTKTFCKVKSESF